MVTFTGSFAVGVNIVRQAAGSVKKVSLELGGKSPNIVFNDADFEAAVQGALLGAFRNAGQVCAAGTRLLVERGIYDRLVAEVVRRAKAIKVGPGLEAASTMGPLAYRDRLDTVEEYVRSGQQEGAKLLCGGKRMNRAGFFYEPTIFGDVDNSMRIAQEEIFGPVLAVIPFDGEEEAIAIANDTIYGLGAGIWTRDLARANRVAKAIRAGMVWVNTYNQSPGYTPWGGYKASGAGRERGEHGLYEFTELKSVVFDASGEPLGFYPSP
jgi:betaine-aldehyde dehydrogenase